MARSKSNHQRFSFLPSFPRLFLFTPHRTTLLLSFPPLLSRFCRQSESKARWRVGDSHRPRKRREREGGQTTSWITFSHRGSFSLAAHLSSVSFQRGWVFRPFAPLFIGTWNKSKESHFFQGYMWVRRRAEWPKTPLLHLLSPWVSFGRQSSLSFPLVEEKSFVPFYHGNPASREWKEIVWGEILSKSRGD